MSQVRTRRKKFTRFSNWDLATVTQIQKAIAPVTLDQLNECVRTIMGGGWDFVETHPEPGAPPLLTAVFVTPPVKIYFTEDPAGTFLLLDAVRGS
ncbi:MAG TPA: hypothetical protein VJS12_07685 [Steroidobacteraceae bacterium]|nr:hypothetical protein [Steroidobacteraceae bacterium]